MPINNIFIKRRHVFVNLQKIRKEKGITQQKLAKKLGVDQTTISKWEKNETYPRLENLKQIAKILQCSLDELVA